MQINKRMLSYRVVRLPQNYLSYDLTFNVREKCIQQPCSIQSNISSRILKVRDACRTGT